jgi:hypothetical protein
LAVKGIQQQLFACFARTCACAFLFDHRCSYKLQGFPSKWMESKRHVLVGVIGDQRSETMESENDRENISKDWNLYLLHR